MPKIDNYLKMLTDEEMKEFLLKTFNENFKSAREILYSKLSEAKNVRSCRVLI